MKKGIIFFIIFIIIIEATLSFLYFNKNKNIDLGFTTIDIPLNRKDELLKTEFFKTEQKSNLYETKGIITNLESKILTVDDNTNKTKMYIYMDTKFTLSEIIDGNEQKRELFIDKAYNDYLKIGKYITVTYEYNRENDFPKAKEIIIWDFIK